jgi:EmrB/QacA subfamily drug resistance transporter
MPRLDGGEGAHGADARGEPRRPAGGRPDVGRVTSVALQRRLVLVATILGSSIAFLDATVVNIALPTIESDLDLGLSGEQWVFASYSLALAALYLPAGALGDRYGYENTFVAGVIGFALASLLAGAAPSAGVLIAARALQGVFGALLTPGSLALLRATFGEESTRAIASWTAWTGIATIAGPPIGGVLIEYVSWRWIFLINLPLAAVAVVAVRASRDACRTEVRARHLDVPGALLATLGVGGLVWGLVEGQRLGFSDPSVVASFVVGAAGLGAFFQVESRAREPMLPLALFRVRDFAVSNVVTIFVYAALGGSLFYLALFVQSVLGYTPLEAGLALAPSSLVMLVLAARLGRMADRVGPRPFLVAGPALIGVGLALMTRLQAGSSYWADLLPPLLVFSLGLAATVPPVTATALKAAPDHLAGVASGVNTTVSRLGQLVAVALLGLVVALVFGSGPGMPLALGERSPDLISRSTDAFQAATWVAAGLAWAGALVALGLSRKVSPQTDRTGV